MEDGVENLPLGIIVCHYSESLVMPTVILGTDLSIMDFYIGSYEEKYQYGLQVQ